MMHLLECVASGDVAKVTGSESPAQKSTEEPGGKML